VFDTRAPAALTGGVALLERAINYTHGALGFVTPQLLARPTPCRDWDLRALLAHMNDSMAALSEAADFGRVDVVPSFGHGEDPVAGLRDQACRLLGAWVAAERNGPVMIGGCALSGAIVCGAGALEIAIHGWDVARACDRDWPLPASLAEQLRALAPMLVTAADRPARFAAPITPSGGDPAEGLLRFLGRDP
jgi:uncharacterized protein (TIGR03086 family)